MKSGERDERQDGDTRRIGQGTRMKRPSRRMNSEVEERGSVGWS